MNHYCCIIEDIRPEGTGTRVTMVVARADWPIARSADLLSRPPIVGRVTSLAKYFKTYGATYAHAFTIAMCQEIEAAMRRGSFPSPNLDIPDIFVTNLMGTDLPKPIGEHFLGMIVYAFSV